MLLAGLVIDTQEILQQFNAARDQYFRDNSGAPELIDPYRSYLLPNGLVAGQIDGTGRIDVIPVGIQEGQNFIRLVPDGSGGYTQTTLQYHSTPDSVFDKFMQAATKAVIIAGTVYVGAGAAGLIGEGGAIGAGAGATSATGVTDAADAVGWTSGYDLPMGSDLVGMTGLGTSPLVSASTLQSGLQLAKTGAGLATTVASIGAGGRTVPSAGATSLPRTLMPTATNYAPQPIVVANTQTDWSKYLPWMLGALGLILLGTSR